MQNQNTPIKHTKQEKRFIRYLGAMVKKYLTDINAPNKIAYKLVLQYEKKEWTVEEYLPLVEVIEKGAVEGTLMHKTWKVVNIKTLYDNNARPFLLATFAPYVDVFVEDGGFMGGVSSEQWRLLIGDEVTIGIADAYIQKYNELENFYEKRKLEISIHTEAATELQKELDAMSEDMENFNKEEYQSKMEEMEFHMVEAQIITQCLMTGNWDENSFDIDLTHFKSSQLLFEYQMEENDLCHQLLELIVYKPDGQSPIKGRSVVGCRDLIKFARFGERMLQVPQPIVEFQICDVSEEELAALQSEVSRLKEEQAELKEEQENIRSFYAERLDAAKIQMSELADIFIEKKWLGKYFELRKGATQAKIDHRKAEVERYREGFVKSATLLQSNLATVNESLSIASTRLYSATHATYKVEAQPEKITFKQMTEAKKMLEATYEKTEDEAKDNSRIELASNIVALGIAQGADKQVATNKAIALTGMLFDSVHSVNALAWLVAMVARKRTGFSTLEPFDVNKIQQMAELFEKRMPLQTAYGVFDFFLSLKRPILTQNSTS